MPTLINRSINLDQSKRFVDTIFLTQGEGGATTLNFVLMQSGAVIDLTGCAVNFLAKKPSGATLTNACTLTNAAQGKAAYVVTTQTATEAGALTDARLEVLKSGVAWKSFKFPVMVEAVPDYTTAIQSTNEFTTLQSLTPQITASTTAIGTLASLLTTAKTNLVAAINELFTNKMNKAGGSANPFTAMPYVGTAPIIESGYVTGKGRYVKYADGTMGCFYTLPITTTVDLNFSLGGQTWYQSARNWIYPVQFYSIDSSVVSCRQNTNNCVLVTNNIVQIDITAVIVNSLTSFASYGLTAVYCEAWGRWKA